MKKYIPVALIALLAGTQIAAVAGPMHDHAQQTDMQAQMGDHKHGDIKDMPANSAEMQKRRQLMQEQMNK